MSEPNRSARAVAADRRILASLVLAAGAVAVAALLTAGAQARSTAAPVNNSPPTISGTAVTGETLTASQGSWTGTPPIQFTWQWRRCDAAGANCADIVGATAQTYLVAAGDDGSTLRVRVRGTNGEGFADADSAPTAVVILVTRPLNTAEPVVSGSPVEGATLSTTTGTWVGPQPIAYAYQWVRCGTDGGLSDGSNCPSIPGATSASYTLTATEIGARLRVQVTASNSNGPATAASNATDTVTQSTTTGPPRNTVEPSVSGTPTVGRALSGSIGTWAGATLSFAQQWVRCGADGGLPDGSNCTPISGATTSSYTLVVDDVGQRIRFRVTASNSLGTQTVASNATNAIASATTTTPTTPQAPRNTFLPSIVGSAVLGQTLTASNGIWTGTTPLLYAYQWVRCGADGGQASGSDCPAITGATGTQYVTTTSDVGQRLRVQVTARNTLGTASATSNATAQVQRTGATPTTTPDTSLPPGGIRLPSGKVSIPVTSVSLPERLIVEEAVFTPNPVRSRTRPIVLRVRVLDTRGYVVRDVLVFTRATPLLTSPVAEQRTGRDGVVRFRMTPRADFPLQDGRSVQFWIRVRKQSDELLAGVSNRRLVQVATKG
jgi:large repetitive protein